MKYRVLILCLMIPCTLWAGCDDLSLPPELTHAQVLAVRADPPALGPAGEADIRLLIAGPDGALTPLAVAGVATFGTLDVVEDGASTGDASAAVLRYRAPEAPSTEAFDDTLTLAIELDDGTVLQAVKRVHVAPNIDELDDVSPVNPEIVALRIGASEVADGATIDALPQEDIDFIGDGDDGGFIDIEVMAADGNSDEWQISWFTTAGTIDRYRSNPSELEISAQPTSGWLYAVVRDGVGTSWHTVRLGAGEVTP